MPWDAARLAMLELQGSGIDYTSWPDGWYRRNDRSLERLHRMQRATLVKVLRACECCAAAVRSELTTGRVAWRPAPARTA